MEPWVLPDGARMAQGDPGWSQDGPGRPRMEPRMEPRWADMALDGADVRWSPDMALDGPYRALHTL